MQALVCTKGAGKTTLLVSASFCYFSAGCFSIWQAVLT